MRSWFLTLAWDEARRQAQVQLTTFDLEWCRGNLSRGTLSSSSRKDANRNKLLELVLGSRS